MVCHHGHKWVVQLNRISHGVPAPFRWGSPIQELIELDMAEPQ